MSTPHKHAAVIKAWANNPSIGIEVKNKYGGWKLTNTPLWHGDTEYRIFSKHRALMDAHAAGAKIELKTASQSWADCNPTWCESTEYRIKPDPFAELKAAHAGGKVIQANDCGQWKDLVGQIWWNLAVEKYRIKPDPTVRYVPIIQLPAGSIVLGEGKICKASAIDPYESGAGKHERVSGVLRIELDPKTLELVSATMEKV